MCVKGEEGKATRLGSGACKSETAAEAERGAKEKLSNEGTIQPMLKRWKPKAQCPFQAERPEVSRPVQGSK